MNTSFKVLGNVKW